MSGPFPPVSLLTNMTILSLSNNQFSGTIPPSLPTLTSLLHLGLSNNDFSQLPDLTPLTSLTYLHLSKNPNLGVASIPPFLTTLTRLQSLGLANLNLGGSIPILISPSLFNIDMSNNSLSGTIPDSLLTAPLQKLILVRSSIPSPPSKF